MRFAYADDMAFGISRAMCSHIATEQFHPGIVTGVPIFGLRRPKTVLFHFIREAPELRNVREIIANVSLDEGPGKNVLLGRSGFNEGTLLFAHLQKGRHVITLRTTHVFVDGPNRVAATSYWCLSLCRFPGHSHRVGEYADHGESWEKNVELLALNLSAMQSLG